MGTAISEDPPELALLPITVQMKPLEAGTDIKKRERIKGRIFLSLFSLQVLLMGMREAGREKEKLKPSVYIEELIAKSKSVTPMQSLKSIDITVSIIT